MTKLKRLKTNDVSIIINLSERFESAKDLEKENNRLDQFLDSDKQ